MKFILWLPDQIYYFYILSVMSLLPLYQIRTRKSCALKILKPIQLLLVAAELTQ